MQRARPAWDPYAPPGLSRHSHPSRKICRPRLILLQLCRRKGGHDGEISKAQQGSIHKRGPSCITCRRGNPASDRPKFGWWSSLGLCPLPVMTPSFAYQVWLLIACKMAMRSLLQLLSAGICFDCTATSHCALNRSTCTMYGNQSVAADLPPAKPVVMPPRVRSNLWDSKHVHCFYHAVYII
jgi:hypothetical protein